MEFLGFLDETDVKHGAIRSIFSERSVGLLIMYS